MAVLGQANGGGGGGLETLLDVTHAGSGGGGAGGASFIPAGGSVQSGGHSELIYGQSTLDGLIEVTIMSID